MLKEFGQEWLGGFEGLGDNWVYLFGDGEELEGVQGKVWGALGKLNGLEDLQGIWEGWRKFGIGEIWKGWGGWWVTCSISLEVGRGLGRLILGPLMIFGGPPPRPDS